MRQRRTFGKKIPILDHLVRAMIARFRLSRAACYLKPLFVKDFATMQTCRDTKQVTEASWPVGKVSTEVPMTWTPLYLCSS